MIKRKHGARGSSWSKADVKNEIIGYSSELSSDYLETFFAEFCVTYSVFDFVHQLLFCLMISTLVESQGDLSIIRFL